MSPVISAIAIGLTIGSYCVAGLPPEAGEMVMGVIVATFSAFAIADMLEYISEIRENHP